MVDLITSEFKRLKRPGEKPGDLLHMINIVEKAHRDLQRMGREHEINNSTIISMIEEKLPIEIESEWMNIITGENKEEIRENKFPALLKLLLRFKDRIEYQQSGLRFLNQNKYSSHHVDNEKCNRLSAAANGNHPDSHPWCWLHPRQTSHPIWRCKQLEESSPEERLQLVKDNKACYACLQEGHFARNCNKQFKCKENNCDLNHHWLLHEAHVEGISFHHESSFENHNTTSTLLLLQRVRASNSSWRMEEIKLLWDSGSTLSFVTFKKANELNLKGTATKLHIVKVCGDMQESDSFRYTVTLRDMNGATIEISVLGIERISSEISNIIYEDNPKIFPGVALTNIRRPRNGEVECLIGFDCAALHPVRTSADGNLLLLENRFGKVIGGNHPHL